MSSLPHRSSPSVEEICALFHQEFFAEYQTVLMGGFSEPFYKAPHGGSSAEIRFTNDYIRSAFHEVAHWCVAGKKRLQEDDFGYWYAPDGRSNEEQALFYQVEVLPQAYECAFCCACGLPFDVSLDNLRGNVDGVAVFKNAVGAKVMALWEEHSFPLRVQRWIDILTHHYTNSGRYDSQIQEIAHYLGSCR